MVDVFDRLALASPDVESDVEAILKLAVEVGGTSTAVVSFPGRASWAWSAREGLRSVPCPQECPFGCQVRPAPSLRVADTRSDPAFSGPVGPTCQPALRRFAGVDIPGGGGGSLGRLAVLDVTAGDFPDAKFDALKLLARQLAGHLARRRTEGEQKLTEWVFRAIASAPDVETALREAVKHICHSTQWTYGETWMLSPKGDRLVPFSAWYGSSPQAAHFHAASAPYSFGPSEGLPGRAWAQRATVWVADILDDTRFPRAAIAREAGLRSAVAVPIATGGDVMAVLLFLSPDLRERDRRVIDHVSAIAAQVGLVFHRRQLEEALILSEKRFRGMAEQARDMLYRRRILPVPATEFVSAAVHELTGYRPDEFYADPALCFNIVHPEDRPALERLLSVTTLNRSPVTIRYMHRDGTTHWVEHRGHLVADETGRVAVVEGIGRDVTDERRRQALMRAVMDGTSDAIFVKDLQGRYLLINKAGAANVGRTVEETLGRDDRALFPVDLAETVMRHDREILETGQTMTEEYEALLGGVKRVLRSTKGPCRDADGNLIGIAGISHDITERRRLEERLRQSEKMESIGRLAGGVAHDFNNLLSAILGFGELACATLAEAHPARAHLAHVLKAGESAAGLTRQLLAFSRKQVLRPQVLDPDEVLHAVEPMLRRLIGEDVRLVFALQAASRVEMDRTQLEQVLLNLAANARDAMPNGGNLTIETRPEVVGPARADEEAGFPPGAYVVLSVSDTGSGIDAATRAHLFEPFFTTKGEGAGTGFGLATVYGIIRQSGGQIRVYSEPGHGTTFRLYLRRIDREAAAATETAAPVRGGEETILLVEDEDAVRLLARTILEGCGYRVIPTGDGDEALRLAAAHAGPIHLVLTDVVMPGMSGRQLVERLQGGRPGLPAIFMSGYTANAIVHHGVLDPGTILIEKPFAPRNWRPRCARSSTGRSRRRGHEGRRAAKCRATSFAYTAPIVALCARIHSLSLVAPVGGCLETSRPAMRPVISSRVRMTSPTVQPINVRPTWESHGGA